MRLIDADKLETSLNETVDAAIKWHDDCLGEIMQNRSEVAKVALAQLWLPFEKEYGEPLHPGFYIVTKQQSTGEKQVAMAHWDGTEWSGNGNFQNVTAFMFAPDPWEGLDD